MIAATEWYDEEIFGIAVWQYLGVLGIIIAALITYVVLTQILATIIRHRFEGDDLVFWNRERRLFNRALKLLSLGVAFLVGFPLLDFDAEVEEIVSKAATFVAAFAVILVAFRVIDVITDEFERRAAATESKIDDNLVPLTRTALRLFASTVGILFVLQNLDVNVTSLIAGLGLGGLAIALAAQDTVRNLMGGITIFADKPFEVGDWVVLDDVEGTVETVGFRSTRLRTFYNSQVSVPNGRLVASDIDNMGRRRWRRYKTTLGVGYHTTPDQMQAFVEGIRAVITSSDKMRHDYYIVEFHGFGSSSLDVLVYCFIDAEDWNEELRVRHVFNLDIMRLAQELQIDFAFPSQTVHVAEMPGQPAQHPAVPDRDHMRDIVDSYGPSGTSGQRVDSTLTAGYDNVPI